MIASILMALVANGVTNDVEGTNTPAPEPVRTVGLCCNHYALRGMGNALL